MDVAFLALTLVFFAASWWFVRAAASLESAGEGRERK
jgi:hypothetical protein